MIQAPASILVKSPPQRVFNFVVVDFTPSYRRWSPEVPRLEILTPGPLRNGASVPNGMREIVACYSLLLLEASLTCVQIRQHAAAFSSAALANVQPGLPFRCQFTVGQGRNDQHLPACSVGSLAHTGSPLNLAQVCDCNETSIPPDASI